MKSFNPVECKGNYSATLNDMKLVQRRWWVGCYIWYSQEETGRGRSPPRPILAVPGVSNSPRVNAHVPIISLLYNGPLLCGLNVGIKQLKTTPRIGPSEQHTQILRHNIVDNDNLIAIRMVRTTAKLSKWAASCWRSSPIQWLTRRGELLNRQITAQ